mgnify:FL=1
MLVDSGATHCYVPSYIVKLNKWAVQESQPCKILLPNGQTLMSNKICGLSIRFNNTPIRKLVTFYVVPIKSTFILGNIFLT